MAVDKSTPATAEGAQGLVITGYSTNLPQACFPKEEAAGAKKDAKKKEAKEVGNCTATFSYYPQYPAAAGKVAKGSLTRGPDGKLKTVTVSPEAKKFLADPKKEEIAKRFGDLVGYVAAWKKPVEKAAAVPEKAEKGVKKPKKTEVLNGALLGTELSDKVINFVVLGSTSPIAGRDIAVDLMQVEKRYLVLKVLGNLKDQAGKVNDPDHQAQKARIEPLITQVTLVGKMEETLSKEAKVVKGDPVSLARSVVATTVSGLSFDGKTSALDFLKSKFDDFAKANPKGVTVVVAGTPPIETTTDPYKFLLDRLSKLKTEVIYQDTQTGPGKLLRESLAFLERAVKDKHIDYVTKSPNEAFSASLKAQIPADLSKLVSNEVTQATFFRAETWKDWMQKKPGDSSNLELIVSQVVGSLHIEGEEKTGVKIKVKTDELDFSTKVFTIGARVDPLRDTVAQRNSYLTSIAVTRALLGMESAPKPTLRVWVNNDFKEVPIEFINDNKKMPGGYRELINNWVAVFGTPVIVVSPSSPAPSGKAPSTSVQQPEAEIHTVKIPPAHEPPPSGVPLVPTRPSSTPSARTTTAFHWSAFAIEAAAVAAGAALLAAGNNNTASPDQGVPGVGNPAFIHSGGALLGFGIGGLAGRGTSLLIGRLQPHKPWTPVRSLIPDIGGALVGGVLGALIPLATRSAVENATGGGNTGRNPGMDYGALITVPLP